MSKGQNDKLFENLPERAAEFITLVIKKIRYRRKVRADVAAELAAHFEDALKDCTTEDEKQKKAEQLIEQFGDVKLLGVLLPFKITYLVFPGEPTLKSKFCL